MEWVMFAFVIAIAIKSYEMTKALAAIEQRLQSLEHRLGERGTSPLSTYAGLDGRLDNLQRQVGLMAEELARDPVREPGRGHPPRRTTRFDPRESVDD